ncbi:MAG: hypothetical protein Kow0090_06470 [Myxococcota bacterium]
MIMEIAKEISYFTALLILVSVTLSSCVFDETELQPVPDEILYPEQEAKEGGGAPKDDCKRAELSLAEFGESDGILTGSWARKVILASETDPRENGDFQDSTTTYYELVEIKHIRTWIRETVELCDLDMVMLAGAKTDYSELFLSVMPYLNEEGEFLKEAIPGETIGAEYANASPLVRLWGLTPEAAEKKWERCDSYFDVKNIAEECPIALWNEITDADCDGNPGISVQITLGALPPEEVYSIRRTKVLRKGEVESKDYIAGKVEFEEETAIIGASKEMFKSNPPFKPVNEKSLFEMVRLSDGADCQAVFKAFNYTP